MKHSVIKNFIAVLFFFFIYLQSHACTIFTLVSQGIVLFCNNEDFNNPVTRIWFVPAGEGCAYVGFDNGWAQGGMNEKGLAFDWVAGYEGRPVVYTDEKRTIGNPSERMLESCANVYEAIAFFKEYREPSFSNAKILVADPGGTSVLIESKDGILNFVIKTVSRGFGYGQKKMEEMLPDNDKETLPKAEAMLKACMQEGEYGTKYSNIFDLTGGCLYIYDFYKNDTCTKLDLTSELENGAHYYDIPRIGEQINGNLLPLLKNMYRLPAYTKEPLPWQDDNIIRIITTFWSKLSEGNLVSNCYTPEFEEFLQNFYPLIQPYFYIPGNLQNAYIVEMSRNAGSTIYDYVMIFDNMRVFAGLELDNEDKLSGLEIYKIE